MNRYDLYAVNLDPTIGAEIKKTRPCILVSPDEMNKHLQTVMVVPLTSQERNIPSRIPVRATPVSGLKQDSFAALDQLKTIDKQRCSAYIGKISEVEALEVADVLCRMFQY